MPQLEMQTHKVSERTLAPVLIIGGCFQVLSIQRSLSRQGIPVEASVSSGCPCYASRFSSHRRYAITKNVDQKEFWHDLLISRCDENLRGAVLLPGSDVAVEFICEHHQALSERYLLYDLSRETHLAFLDKEHTLNLATKARIPAPRFLSSAEMDLDRIVSSLSFPIIVKPRSSHLFTQKFIGKKHFRANGVDDLIRYVNVAKTQGVDCILSEFIPGPDSLSRFYTTYRNSQGRPLFEFTRRILRRQPTNEGIATYQVSEWDLEVADLGRRLLGSVDFRGIASIEFKRDPRDGFYKLIEVNPRLPNSYECMELSGIKAAYMIHCDVTGRSVSDCKAYRDGTRLMNIPYDLKAFLQLRSRGEVTFLGWLKTLSFRQHYEFFAWNDPLPALTYHLKHIGNRVRRRRT